MWREIIMASKTDTEVIIGGKVYTLSGYESEEYLQKVASYINNKIAEYNKIEGFKRQPIDTQNVLLQLNIADDYFKGKKQLEMMEEQLAEKEKELYDIKHDLITTQIKLETAEKNGKSLQTKLDESSKKINQLESQIKSGKK
jgi:cell division protein ZapA